MFTFKHKWMRSERKSWAFPVKTYYVNLYVLLYCEQVQSDLTVIGIAMERQCHIILEVSEQYKIVILSTLQKGGPCLASG